MNQTEIQQTISQARWYHQYEILPGIVTPGSCRVEAEKSLTTYGVPADLSGKTALDIGAWDGPFAFELERRGAVVTAVDIQDPDRTAFNTAKRIKQSAVRYVRASVYDLTPSLVGPFDLVLFLGVFYHLKNPLLALQKIRSVLNPGGLVYFEGAILDHADKIDEAWKGREELMRACSQLPITYFTSGKFANDPSNWFIPSRLCVEEWLKATGFGHIHTEINEPYSRIYGHAQVDETFKDLEHSLV